MMNWGRFGSGLMFMILFWTAVVLFSIWLYKQVKGLKDVTLVESTLEILKKTYIPKGRLKKRSLKRRKKDLEK
jgi:hypothetical protein